MIGKLINFFSNPAAQPENSEKRIAISTAALLIEAANSDDNFSTVERNKINEILKTHFNFNDEEIEELLQLANEKIEKSVSFYEFTNVLNSSFNRDEKYEIIKLIWEILLLDKKLESNEEYFIRTISRNLHLDHRDFIAAKMDVKKKLGLN